MGDAHARQMDLGVQKQWSKELQRECSKDLGVARWLCSSIVKLLVNHEGSYLEHCRKYALDSKP